VLHECGISWLLISEAFEVESLFDQHAIELAPRDDSLMVIICLIEQPEQALIDLFLSVLQFSLPRFEVFDALGDEFVEGELVGVLFKCVFEETEDVFINIYRQICGQFLHLKV